MSNQEAPQTAIARARTELAKVVDPTSGLDYLTLATVMIESGFFPDVKSVAQGVVKILAGKELGYPAIASLRHIYVRDGHIGLQAALIATKIRQSGTYDYRVVRCDDDGAEIEIVRVLNGQRASEGTASFTLADAKRAGLVRERGGYTTYPSDLMFARALTRAQRRFCPDIFGQTVYAAEELNEIPRDSDATDDAKGEVVADLMPHRKGETAVQASEDVAPAQMVEELPTVPTDTEFAAELWQKHVDPGMDRAPQPPSSPPVTSPGPESGISEIPKTVTFTLGSRTYTTAGIAREQLLKAFNLGDRVNKKAGSDLARAVLRKEFGVQSRVDLTEEQASRYLVRLNEILEG